MYIMMDIDGLSAFQVFEAQARLKQARIVNTRLSHGILFVAKILMYPPRKSRISRNQLLKPSPTKAVDQKHCNSSLLAGTKQSKDWLDNLKRLKRYNTEAKQLLTNVSLRKEKMKHRETLILHSIQDPIDKRFFFSFTGTKPLSVHQSLEQIAVLAIPDEDGKVRISASLYIGKHIMCWQLSQAPSMNWTS